jgi:hypothetical protein
MKTRFPLSPQAAAVQLGSPYTKEYEKLYIAYAGFKTLVPRRPLFEYVDLSNCSKRFRPQVIKDFENYNRNRKLVVNVIKKVAQSKNISLVLDISDVFIGKELILKNGIDLSTDILNAVEAKK